MRNRQGESGQQRRLAGVGAALPYVAMAILAEAVDEQAWTRSQIHRGWIFAHELGAVLAGFDRDRENATNGGFAHVSD